MPDEGWQHGRTVGEATPVAGRRGALKVRFAPDWLARLPGMWADHWVIKLDPDYR